MYFAENIKLLRKRRGRTQDDVAQALGLKRSTLSGYENRVAQPNMDALVALSEYFNVAIDTLVKVDLQSLSESQLRQLESGFDVFVKGKGLRVLVSTVDAENNENIELIPEKAKAGYTTGYADPEYINELPVFHLPFLSKDKKYRTFQISGDSMLPVPEGAWVTGEYLQDWTTVKTGDACIVVTLDDGVVFKIVENRLEEHRELILHSLNPQFEPYSVAAADIREVWRFVHYISDDVPESTADMQNIARSLFELKNDVKRIKEHLNR
ncbi:MAG: LexA family transcriptional regulator [Chlorobi bacterium]|nr:LexA family transcriptional regulator [Chlorobiota bacterium]